MNDQLHVHGGTPLRGSVTVRGAKNSSPKISVAALLAPATSLLENVPNIKDTEIVRALLEAHGARTNLKNGRLSIDASEMGTPDRESVRAIAGTSRIPVLFCGPLLHRLGSAYIPGLGGCLIGDRPVDLHIQVLQKFGALVEEDTEGGLYVRAPYGLKGTDITLPYPSVGATEQALLTAVSAKGTTEITNVAVETEIIDLICALQKMGANVAFTDDRTIVITGRDRLRGYTHRVMTDRIEAASWGAVALATDGEIEVRGASQEGMIAFLGVFQDLGGEWRAHENGITFSRSSEQPTHFQIVETGVHPGFQTDWQQPLVAALTQRPGKTMIHETVWEDRLRGVAHSLVDMGADIEMRQGCSGRRPCRFANGNSVHSALVNGTTALHGASLQVPDLRGGFALLIAALAASGSSTLHGTALLERGYENLLGKLQGLGAKVS